MSRKSWSAAVAITLLHASFSAPALAQEKYPARIVQVVDPYQAGSTTDILARALAVGLSNDLGQQFIVLNKAGAGGTVGTAFVTRSSPDGYTLLFAPVVVLSVAPQIRPRAEVGYAPGALIPICQTFVNTMGLLVKDDSPIKTLTDLVRLARQQPGTLNYGHQGLSSIPQLAMEAFLDTAQVKIHGIPYHGDPEVVTDLLGGRIDVASVVLGAVGIAGHGARIIAVFADERHPSYPEAPTAREQGFDVAPTSFGGLFAPYGTPQGVVDTLSRSCAKAAKEDVYVAAAQHAAQPRSYFADRDEFQARLQRDVEAKKEILDRLGQSVRE